MRRENILARLILALSGETQEQLAEAAGLHPTQIAQFELGEVAPSPEHLKAMAMSAGITLREAEEILRLADELHGRRA